MTTQAKQQNGAGVASSDARPMVTTTDPPAELELLYPVPIERWHSRSSHRVDLGRLQIGA